MTIERLITGAGIGIVVLTVFVIGFWLGGLGRSPEASGADGTTGSTAAEVPQQIWTCSMHPQIRKTEPGQCPICGMDLVPVAADDTAQKEAKPSVRTKSAKKKYACSMFCVPPLPRPGKCPICGMEMVEVEDDHVEDDKPVSQLRLSPNAEKLAEIRIAPVERKFVEANVRLVGKVTYDETRVAYITSWIPGRLDRLFVDYTGIAVRKGDRLVYTYSPELLSAQEELFQAKRAAKRLESSSLKSMRDTAKKTVDAVREKLRLFGLTAAQITEIETRGTPSDHLTILAPMSGIVVDKTAREGMYVSVGTRIYTIADLSVVWVKLDAYESDLLWLRYGQEVEFATEAYPGETFRGKIAFIDPVLDGRTRTVKVRVNVPNEDGRLKPDMFVRGIVRSRVASGGKVMDAALAGKWISPKHPEIVKDGPGTCDKCGVPLVRAESLGYVAADATHGNAPLVIPASAPLITGKRAVVYVAVKGEPGLYEGRDIVLGPRAGAFYVVREGLREGERVVVNGNFKIDSAIQIRSRPSMMNPARREPASAAPGQPAAGPKKPVASAGAASVPAEFRAKLSAVFRPYLAIQTGLSQDSRESLAAHATTMASALEAIDPIRLEKSLRDRWRDSADVVRKSAGALGAAGDIKAAREAFAGMSEGMIALAAAFGTGLDVPVYRVRCPMAFANRGASWLQEAEKTENPYYGAAMFRCGVRQATYEPHSSTAALGPQTNCPIMGQPINREVFTDYEGQRVYFCCPPCIEKFLASPEKHLGAMKAAGEKPERPPSK